MCRVLDFAFEVPVVIVTPLFDEGATKVKSGYHTESSKCVHFFAALISPTITKDSQTLFFAKALNHQVIHSLKDFSL